MTAVVTGPGVGPMLREWRNRRRISQLDLALRAESSARHISFVETGRSQPSREMVLRLAEHLDVPVRERNALLVAAGFAPYFPEHSLDDPAMADLRATMEQLLAAYDPFPAVAVDGIYRVVAANRGAMWMLDGVAAELLGGSLNAMRLTLHPRGMAPYIRNYTEWRAHLLQQLRRQLAQRRSEPLRALYDEVSAYPAPELTGPETTAAVWWSSGGHRRVTSPYALPLLLDRDGQVLSFVSVIATFNTPMDVTVSELALETFLPADQDTAEYLRSKQR